MAAGAPKKDTAPAHEALTQAKGLAETLPDLLVEAERVANTVLAGWHGRRRSGPGETFWQFRTFIPGEPSSGIDWRRSARDEQHLYVREREWEAAHTIWTWPDLSVSMNFRSRLGNASKRDRALVLLLALAELLAAAGERVGLLGGGPAILSRNAAERIANSLAHLDAPPVIDRHLMRRFTEVVLFSDFLDPLPELEEKLSAIAHAGARGHLVAIYDPVEETFPYSGRTEFQDPETGQRHVVGRAESYKADYAAKLSAHRAWLADFCRRLDWTFLIHRTDRAPTAPLLALHARLADRGDRVPGGLAA
jgi:uncharacterized protein (DUF58 family)